MKTPATCEPTSDERGRDRPTVLVFRALRGIGDILCVVPSLRHIRTTLPHARVVFMGVEEVQPLLGRFSRYIDDLVPFPGYPKIPEPGASGTSVVLPSADLVLQLHGDGSVSNGFVATLDAKAIAAAGPLVAAECHAVHTRAYDHSLHEIERCLQVTDDGLRLLGERPGAPSTELEFPIRREEREEAGSLLAGLGLLHAPGDGSGAHPGDVPWRGGAPRPFVVLHPGSHLHDRRWPADRFIELGNALFERGMSVLVTGSGDDEVTLAKSVVEGMRTRPGGMWVAARAVNIAGRLSLGGLAALLEHAAGLITNDTGISHLATAIHTRSVVIFMASDAMRWAPLDRALHAAVTLEAPSGVRPDAVSPEGRALLIPSVEQVLEAVAGIGIAQQFPLTGNVGTPGSKTTAMA